MIKLLGLSTALLITGCTMEGIVYDENGNPIVNATLLASDGEISQEVYTNELGEYSIDEFGVGAEVFMVASKEGYYTQSKHVIVAIDVSSSPDFMIKNDSYAPPVEYITGRLLDSNGNVTEGYAQAIKDTDTNPTRDYFYKNPNYISEYGNKPYDFFPIGTLNIGDFSGELKDEGEKVAIRYYFSASDKNFYSFDRTYKIRDYLDINDSTIMLIGDISAKVGSLKVCAKNLDGSDFFNNSYDDNSSAGISFDNRFNTFPTKLIKKDNGEFEYNLFNDNKMHTLTVRDKLGNTDTIEFLANSDEIDLRSSCVQAKEKVTQDIEVKIDIDSEYSVDQVKIIYLGDQDEDDIYIFEDVNLVDAKFSINKSGHYMLRLIDNNSTSSISNQIGFAFSEESIKFNLNANGKSNSIEAFAKFVPEIGTVSYSSSRFELYQGEIVFDREN